MRVATACTGVWEANVVAKGDESIVMSCGYQFRLNRVSQNLISTSVM
jgi:hypothetical protein